ncbi:MAG: hypothetical protein PHO37_17975 [Kiritimatiellae bacterium]|nr:hypothetical protein [Kiritimatiellia bacterium]
MKPHSRLHILTFTAVMTLCAATAGSTPAVITDSDGAVFSGELSLIGARPLTMVALGDNRQQKFNLDDIVAIEQLVESATMERPWVFKESGKADKVYLDGQYPLINFKTTLTLVSGSVVTGHLISVAFNFKSEAAKRKIFLTRQIKGAKEELLDDIIYVSNIRLTANAVAGGGSISGRVEGFGALISVSALDNAREQPVFAKVAKDGSFDFGALLPGSYDLCVLTDTHVLCGISDATPAPQAGGDPLQAEDLAGINLKFPLADDFFNDRWILGLRGNRKFAKVLVYKRRADYYEAEKWTPGGFLWHLELWSWHLAGSEWKIDRRSILIRHKQQGGEKNRKLLTTPLFEAVPLGRRLDIRIGDDNEPWTFIRDLD